MRMKTLTEAPDTLFRQLKKRRKRVEKGRTKL